MTIKIKTNFAVDTTTFCYKKLNLHLGYNASFQNKCHLKITKKKKVHFNASLKTKDKN